MESENDVERNVLREIDSIRARTAATPRGHAVLQLAYTMLLAGYMAVLIYTGSTEGGASVLGGTTMALVLPPLIVSTGLISGANERFGERLRATARQWVALGFFLVVFVALLIWGIAGDGYPWWLAIVAAAATLLIFGVRPLNVLMRHPAPPHEARSRPGPLPGAAKVTTVLLGVFFGLECSVVLVPAAASVVTIVGLLGVIVALAARSAPWGLLHTGFEWRLPQWVGFGVAAAVMFALALLSVATALVTPVVAVSAGAVVAVSVIVSAFIPRRAHGAPAA
jgi:hypothetical protein